MTLFEYADPYGVLVALAQRKAARPDRQRAAGYRRPADNWPPLTKGEPR